MKHFAVNIRSILYDVPLKSEETGLSLSKLRTAIKGMASAVAAKGDKEQFGKK